MRNFKFTIVLLFVSFTCIAQQNRERQSQQLDSLFTMLNAQYQFNGSVLIAERGKIILNKGYGLRNEINKRRNDENTIFELASCSKPFTAGAIVLLRREGKLSYDDKITKYIPELSHWGKITIYDLLRHTSGIPDFIYDMPESSDKTRIATNEDVIKFYASKDTLEFIPGTRHSYSNTNYVLLASIIERVSKKSYATFLTEHIFRPLKMKNTFVYNRRMASRNLKNYATGYVWAKNSFTKVVSEDSLYDGGRRVYFLDGVVGNAKVNSTTADIYKWLIALNNNSLFTKSEFEEMTQITKTAEGSNIPYGFGLDISKGENSFAFGHTGRWDGYVTFIYNNIVKDRIIIILQNFDFGAYSFDNISQVLNGQKLVTEYRKKVDMAEAELQKYAGTYTSDNQGDTQIITVLDGHLVHNSNRVPWDLRFFPVTANEFQGIMVGGNDGMIRFTPLENGHMKLEMFQYGELIGSGTRRGKME